MEYCPRNVRGLLRGRFCACFGGDSAAMSAATPPSDPEVAAEQLFESMVRSGCDTLNIRVFLAGLSPAQVHEQIARHGAETVPRLRQLLAR